jgi:hypothetical protein
MAGFLPLVTGGLVFSQIELKKAKNAALAVQALESADAGLQHALSWNVIPWAWDFSWLINCPSQPCSILSASSYLSSVPLFTDSVSAINDPADQGGATDTNNVVILQSTALGPNSTKRELQAYVKRSVAGFTPPGALYLPASGAIISFDSGSLFLISGNDTNYDGAAAANAKTSIYGVATLDSPITDLFKSVLGTSRYSRAQWLGYQVQPSGTTPSIFSTTNEFDVNQIAIKFYNHPSAVKHLSGLRLNCLSSNPCRLGTDASPQITYICESASGHIHLDGHVYGSGVLVVEGKLPLYGNFDFHGIIISVNLGLTGGIGNDLDDVNPFLSGRRGASRDLT